MKTCSRCKETKPLTDFNKRAGTKDGLKSQCRVCSNLASQETRARMKGIEIPYNPLRPADVDGKRWCSRCKTYKEKTNFFVVSANNSGLSSYCKACETTRKIKTRNNITLHSRRMYSMKVDFGITETDFQDIMNTQLGCCAICGKDFGDIKTRAHVDHNHETNQVRGLLCYKCNVLLGYAKEDRDVLFNAVTYLDSWEYVS